MGYNLPPGVSDADIDALFAAPRLCETCLMWEPPGEGEEDGDGWDGTCLRYDSETAPDDGAECYAWKEA